MRSYLFVFSGFFLILALGCAQLEGMLNQVDKPTARLVTAELGSLDLEKIRLNTVIEVENPYAVALPIPRLDYALRTGGESFLNGEQQIGSVIPAKGKLPITLPIDISFAGLLGLAQGLRPGQSVPYETEVGISVDAPGLGLLRLPVRHSSELPIPAIPDVRLASMSWKDLSLTGAKLNMLLDIGNTNSFDLSLASMAFGLKVAGQNVVTSSVSDYATIPAGERRQVEVGVDTRFTQMGLSLLRILSGDGAETSLTGTLDLDTPFGKLATPFESKGFTPFR